MDWFKQGRTLFMTHTHTRTYYSHCTHWLMVMSLCCSGWAYANDGAVYDADAVAETDETAEMIKTAELLETANTADAPVHISNITPIHEQVIEQNVGQNVG